MRKKALEYNTFLHERLQDESYALEYLKEAMLDEDMRVFLMAIKQVADAKGITMEELAKRCAVNRVTLYRMLSNNGNPGFLKVMQILKNLGFSFDIRLEA